MAAKRGLVSIRGTIKTSIRALALLATDPPTSGIRSAQQLTSQQEHRAELLPLPRQTAKPPGDRRAYQPRHRARETKANGLGHE